VTSQKNVRMMRTALVAFGCCLATGSAADDERALDDVFHWRTRQRVSVHMSTVLRQALEESVDIEVDRYDPLIAAARLRSARGPLEPLWETSVNYQHRERLINQYDANSLRLISSVENGQSQLGALQTREQQLTDAGNSLGSTLNAGSASAVEVQNAVAINQSLASNTAQLQSAQNSINAFDPGALKLIDFEEDLRQYKSGLSQRLPTGTRWELSVQENRTEDTFTKSLDSFGRPVYPLYPSDQEAYGRFRVSQPILRDFGFAANLVEIRVGRAQKKAADADFEAGLQRRMTDIIGAYLNLTYALGEVDAQREVLNYSSTLVDQNKKRQSEGQVDIVEVRRAETALSESEQQYLDAQKRALEQQNKLLRLSTSRLDLDAPILLIPVEGLQTPKLPEATYKEMMAVALKERSEYTAAKYDVEVGKARLAYAKNQTLPQLDVIGSYALRGLANGGGEAVDEALNLKHHEWFAGFQLSVPIGNSKALGDRDRARAMFDETETKVKLVEANISLQVINSLNNCRAGYAQIAKAVEGRKAAEETRYAETRRLEEGQTTTLSVLETQRDLRRALLRELSAQLEYQRSLVLLDAAQGILLEKHNIVVEKPKPPKAK
jgi:outer membrane protein